MSERHGHTPPAGYDAADHPAFAVTVDVVDALLQREDFVASMALLFIVGLLLLWIAPETKNEELPE